MAQGSKTPPTSKTSKYVKEQTSSPAGLRK